MGSRSGWDVNRPEHAETPDVEVNIKDHTDLVHDHWGDEDDGVLGYIMNDEQQVREGCRVQLLTCYFRQLQRNDWRPRYGQKQNKYNAGSKGTDNVMEMDEQ
jgi:hypothetical protein